MKLLLSILFVNGIFFSPIKDTLGVHTINSEMISFTESVDTIDTLDQFLDESNSLDFNLDNWTVFDMENFPEIFEMIQKEIKHSDIIINEIKIPNANLNSEEFSKFSKNLDSLMNKFLKEYNNGERIEPVK